MTTILQEPPVKRRIANRQIALEFVGWLIVAARELLRQPSHDAGERVWHVIILSLAAVAFAHCATAFYHNRKLVQQ